MNEAEYRPDSKTDCESGKDTRLIGTEQFGFTNASIETVLKALEIELSEIQLDLKSEDDSGLAPDIAARYRTRLEQRRVSIEKVLQQSTNDIFHLLEKVYAFVLERETQQVTVSEIVADLQREDPSLFDAVKNLYAIVRQQPWGYRLGQRFFFAAINK